MYNVVALWPRFAYVLVHALQQRIYQGSHGSLPRHTTVVVINRQKINSASNTKRNYRHLYSHAFNQHQPKVSFNKDVCTSMCAGLSFRNEKTSSLTNRPWNVISSFNDNPSCTDSASSDFSKTHHQQHETLAAYDTWILRWNPRKMFFNSGGHADKHTRTFNDVQSSNKDYIDDIARTVVGGNDVCGKLCVRDLLRIFHLR